MRPRKIPNKFKFALIVGRGKLWSMYSTRKDALREQDQFEQYYATGSTARSSRIVPVRVMIEARL